MQYIRVSQFLKLLSFNYRKVVGRSICYCSENQVFRGCYKPRHVTKRDMFLFISSTNLDLENEVFGGVNNLDMSLIKTCFCSPLYDNLVQWFHQNFAFHNGARTGDVIKVISGSPQKKVELPTTIFKLYHVSFSNARNQTLQVWV